MSTILPIKTEELGEGIHKKAVNEILLAGDPDFITWAQDESLDGRVATGVWQATPGETLSSKNSMFEFCHILDGVVELTSETGEKWTFGAGDSFIMKPGFKGVWKTVETLRKIYVVVT